MAGAVYAVGGILFIILARGTLQPWAVDTSSGSKDEKESQPLSEVQFLNKKPLGENTATGC